MKRVVFLVAVFFAMFSFSLFCGCSKKSGATNPLDSGTGVSGLDRPDEILSNPYVRDAIKTAQNKGLYISPEKSLDPPVISGTYNMSGKRYFPGNVDLAVGVWIWSNQTRNNYIDTDYDQGIQLGVSGGGEIIRGTTNRFTVYSVLDVNTYGHKDRFVVLIDGQQDSDGNITAIYVGAPVNDNSYLQPSGGKLNLTLTGAAKQIPANSGGFLIETIEKTLKLPN